MQNLSSIAWNGVLIVFACAAAYGLIVAAKHRKKWLPPLEELVTLDARGWRLIATVASVGAAVMIATSQLFSASYWLGLAIDSDGRKIPEGAGIVGFVYLISVATVAALALSIIFELVADIGAPTASGLKKEKKKGTPEILLIVTAFAIVMSLASKWGFYEDRRQARAAEAAKLQVSDQTAADRLAEANATIARLQDAPSEEIAKTTEASIAARIEDATTQRENAIAARDALPEGQGSNKAKFQATIDALTTRLDTLEGEKIAAQKIREDAKALADARAARTAALAIIEKDAGKLTGEGREIVRIGDTVIIRLIRSGLHQALCFLFPIIALDAWSTHRRVRTREIAAQKGAETRRNNNPNAVREAEFEPADDAEPEQRFGGYLAAAPPAEGEAPDAAKDADFDDGLTGEDPGAGENEDTGEGPDDAKT